jgi:hypothetical protein
LEDEYNEKISQMLGLFSRDIFFHLDDLYMTYLGLKNASDTDTIINLFL